MKTFIGHEACPNCGSKDNVGVWSDGQKYCFGGCGFFIPGYKGMSIEDIKKQLKYEQEKEKKNAAVGLPADYSLVLRPDAEAWLKKYGITDAERMRFKLGWSEIYESLVLPAFDFAGNLLICQRRYFGTDNWPKYHTKGYPESVVWTVLPLSVGNRADPRDTYNGTLVLVEDYISAVKVGREHEASPLWGSSLSLNQIKRLSDRWEELILWLDFNKTSTAMQYRFKAKPYFNNVSVVATQGDPKDYDDSQIRQILAQT